MESAGDFEGHQIEIPAPALALIVTEDEAWLLNSRVRDNEVEPTFSDYGTRFSAKFESEALRVNPRPLALQIIRALRDLHTMAETSILVSEEECWFLERRVRHNDREPAARTLLKKVHILLLEFHSELAPIIPQEGEVEANADRSYEDAIKDADPDSDADTSKDTPTESGAGDGTVPAE